MGAGEVGDESASFFFQQGMSFLERLAARGRMKESLLKRLSRKFWEMSKAEFEKTKDLLKREEVLDDAIEEVDWDFGHDFTPGDPDNVRFSMTTVEHDPQGTYLTDRLDKMDMPYSSEVVDGAVIVEVPPDAVPACDNLIEAMTTAGVYQMDEGRFQYSDSYIAARDAYSVETKNVFVDELDPAAAELVMVELDAQGIPYDTLQTAPDGPVKIIAEIPNESQANGLRERISSGKVLEDAKARNAPSVSGRKTRTRATDLYEELSESNTIKESKSAKKMVDASKKRAERAKKSQIPASDEKRLRKLSKNLEAGKAVKPKVPKTGNRGVL